MGDLSKNFSRIEFSCKCGCGRDTVDAELIKLCEVVRDFEARPVKVNCGFRCPTHNVKVGGNLNSMHMLGRAADLHVRNPAETYDYLCRLFTGKYGFGLYKTFIHVDSRSGPARWDMTSEG